MSDLPFDPSEVTTRLLHWYGQAGRSFPWRETRDPYRIWLSEIMLQQTGVIAVQPYYRRFLERFPTVVDLAGAPEEEVTDLWAGLGYYNRARNLHAAAKQVVAAHGGKLPADLTALMALPGIGRSTAGAILSIAFDRPAPILDGNVRRVLCRLFALQADPRSTASEKKLWAWSEALTSVERPHDYTQAIMDLGAVICIPRTPRCDECPVEPFCEARRLGLEQELPQKRPKKSVPTRHQVALVIAWDDNVFVRRRPTDGMLAGLWEFPTLEVSKDGAQASAVQALCESLCLGGKPALLGQVRHAYSHFKLELALYRVSLKAPFDANETARWCPRGELKNLSLHGAHKKALPLLDCDSL